MGEPVRLMVDLPNEAEIVALLCTAPTEICLSPPMPATASCCPRPRSSPRPGPASRSSTSRPLPARVCIPRAGDHVAVVGENRKLVVFPLDDLPRMGRGKGVRLQRYKDGGLSDARTFMLSDGLSWKDPAGRTRTQTDLTEWVAKRATAGRMAPRGFPRDNRFT